MQKNFTDSNTPTDFEKSLSGLSICFCVLNFLLTDSRGSLPLQNRCKLPYENQPFPALFCMRNSPALKRRRQSVLVRFENRSHCSRFARSFSSSHNVQKRDSEPLPAPRRRRQSVLMRFENRSHCSRFARSFSPHKT